MKKGDIVNKLISEKFASKAQQRFFYAMADKDTKKGKKFKKWSKEFSDDTDFDEIPEKVKKKKNKSKKESTNPKMENRNTVKGLLNEGENSALVYVLLFLSATLSQIPIKQWPQHFAENSRDIFIDFLKFMRRFGYDADTEYIKNNFNILIKKSLGKLYKEGGIHQDLDETNNPKMKKGELMEYINFKKNGGVKKLRKKDIVKEQRDQDIHIIEEMDNHDRRDVMRYLEYIRQSGVINMFGAHPILNWTKKDLHRWLYGQKQDPEYIEEQIEELKDDYEDDNESEIDSLEEQLSIINYLLDNKQKIRDILIRTAMRRIENGGGDMETSKVQRVFEKLAKESWMMWTTGIYGQ